MAELTKHDIIDAVAEGLRAGGFEARVVEISKTTFEHEFLPSITEKLEKIGIDCSSPETREASRKDMEHLRRLRLHAESDKGKEDAATLSQVLSMASAGATHVLRLAVLCFVLGALALISAGASQQGWLKTFLSSQSSH